MRRAFATLRLVLTEADGEIQVWGVNDGPEPVAGEMRWGVFNLAGGFPFDKRQKVQLAANTATVLAVLPAGVWTDPLGQFPYASLEVAGRLVTRNRFYAPLFKELHWPQAEVNVQVVKGQAVFTAPVFVWGVCLDLDGEQPLADNFFDLWPGLPHSIPWSGSASPKVLFTGNLR